MSKVLIVEFAQAISSGFGGMAFGLFMGWDKSLGLLALARWGVCTLVLSPTTWFITKEYTDSTAIIFGITAVSACFGYFILIGLFKLAKVFRDQPLQTIVKVRKKK